MNFVGRVSGNSSALSVATPALPPPALVITSPVQNGIVTTRDVVVTYTESGNLSLVNHTHLQLDSQEVMDLDNDGSYIFLNVEDGSHSLSVWMVLENHTLVGSIASVNFSVTVPATPPPDGGGGNNGGGGGGISKPMPKAQPVNNTNDTILVGEKLNRIEIGEEVTIVNIKEEENIIVGLDGEGYEMSFEIVEGGVLVKLANGEFLIPKDDVLAVLMGDREVYVGINNIEKGEIVLGLDKDKVRGEVIEEKKVDVLGKKGNFIIIILASIAGLIFIAIIVLSVIYWKRNNS